jgi:hypothetical protein
MNSVVDGQPWTPPVRLPGGQLANPGAEVATGIQGGNMLDVFVIDKTGQLRVTWHVPGENAWRGPATIAYAQGFKPGGAMATGRQNGHVLDLFAVDSQGTLVEAWLLDTFQGGWRGPYPISSSGFAPPGAHVATGKQGANTLDVFVVGNDGQLHVTWLVADGPPGWPQPQPIPFLSTYSPGFPPGAAIATAIQDNAALDVFIVDNDGAVTVSWLVGEGANGWQGPAQMPGPQHVAPPGGAIVADHQLDWVVDVIVAGNKGLFGRFAVSSGGWSAPMFAIF